VSNHIDVEHLRLEPGQITAHVSSENLMIVPGSSFRCGYAIEFVAWLLMID
jgi:hypothetical protein